MSQIIEVPGTNYVPYPSDINIHNFNFTLPTLSMHDFNYLNKKNLVSKREVMVNTMRNHDMMIAKPRNLGSSEISLPLTEEEARLPFLHELVADFYALELIVAKLMNAVSEEEINSIVVDNREFYESIKQWALKLKDCDIDYILTNETKPFLSKEATALIAAIIQYELVEKLDKCFVSYFHAAIGAELRYHPFIHMYVYQSQRTYYYPEECEEKDYRDRNEQCYCDYHINRMDGITDFIKFPGATIDEEERNICREFWLQWAIEQPSSLYDFAADLFREFTDEEGYGGDAWADAAMVLKMRLDGTLGPTEFKNKKLFVDRAISLEHNGGCFFDKMYNIEIGMARVLNAHAFGRDETLYNLTCNPLTRILYRNMQLLTER